MNSDISEKLSKLIPRLSSDQDGEVVATVNAIKRVLKAGGFDMHDLAAELTKPMRTAASRDGYHHGYYQAQPKPPSKGLHDENGFFRPWNQVVGEILERHETIPKRYGGKFLTKDQITKLERIFRGELAAHFHERMLKVIDDRLRTAAKAQNDDQAGKAA